MNRNSIGTIFVQQNFTIVTFHICNLGYCVSNVLIVSLELGFLLIYRVAVYGSVAGNFEREAKFRGI